MAATINARAQTGFAKASAYDQHRPTYPPHSTQLLLEKTRVAGVRHAKIIDLAAGTGKFTIALAAREEEFEVLAVEPHDGMRAVLNQKGLRDVDVRKGVADSIPAGDGSVDAVLVAQAFHWFANTSTLQEIHRVLKPHGSIGLIWNIEDYNAPHSHQAATAWESKIHNLTWTFDDKEPRFRHEQWHKVFDEQIKSTPMSLLRAADPLFALPLGEERERWEFWLPREKVWERYNTISHISVLEGKERERTYRTFMDAINHPDVETNEKGEIAVHGTTYTIWTTKVPAKGAESLVDSLSSVPKPAA